MEKSWGEKLSTVDLSYKSLLPGWTLCDKVCGEGGRRKKTIMQLKVFFTFAFCLYCDNGALGGNWMWEV